MNEVLKIKNVFLTYQSEQSQTEALKNISFSVKQGEFVSIVGPSGCGKTTILSLIAGLLKPTKGEILINDSLVNGVSEKVGYMLQKDHLFQWRTVEENAMLGLEIKKIKTAKNVENVKNLLEKYGLGEFKKHYPRQLSGGMRQRVSLIRTLAFNPEILLLDEPFSALDFQTRLNVCDDVYSIIKNEKKTAILVTHDISEAVSLADKVIVLSKRPASINCTFDIDIDQQTPLKKREDPKFSIWFNKIWKEIPQ